MQNDGTPNPLNPGLRRRAENEVSEKMCSSANLSEIDVRALCHELQVHQVELEMQNEELQRVQAELASSEEKYRDLFEFAQLVTSSLMILGRSKKQIQLPHRSSGLLGSTWLTTVSKPTFHRAAFQSSMNSAAV